MQVLDVPTKEAATQVTPVSRGHGVLLAWLALLLAAAVGLQILPERQSVIIKREAPLAEYFPREMSGWHSDDRPPAESDAEIARVKRLLNYDETLLRFYRKGERQFSLYVSYWRPGKMPAREIAFHIPDVCWVFSGWKQHVADYHYRHEFEGRWLAPAQYREFDAPNERQHVLYWHILSGQAVDFGSDGAPSQQTTLEAVLHHGLNQKGEQYFIRIASRSTLDDLWNDEGFQEIMELIAPLGPGLHSTVDRF
jgi:hypothetical protein